MAFNLFPKPPAKGKPGEVKPADPKAPAAEPRAGARTVSARELAATAKSRSAKERMEEAREREITVTGPQSILEWTAPQTHRIQVAEANPGLCAVLENAALQFANGQAAQAREV